MALDRLDAVVIGASVEGLVAAAALAKAGRAVTVVERERVADASTVEDAVVSLETVRSLDLASHGLRFAAPPPVVGIAGDRALVLWPDRNAARSAIAAFAPRDAEAWDAFHARIARAAAPLRTMSEPQPLSAWLLSPGAAEAAPTDHMLFRASALARLLDEAFDNDLLKGLLAQSAVMGTGASPLAPGSGVLLMRQAMLAAAELDPACRFVAGGKAALTQALLSLLKFYNNADVRFAAEVRELAAERDAVQAVILSDGTTLRAPLVISALTLERHRELLPGLRRGIAFDTSPNGDVEPAEVRFTTGALPKLPGLDAATLACGAVVRLSPSIQRLARAHAAFRARALPQDPCLELRVTSQSAKDGKPRWRVTVTFPYLPATTTDGPWTGARRDGVRGLCVRVLDAVSPGFGASIETAEVVRPKESATIMDAKGAAALAAKAALDLTGVPALRAAAATPLLKGLNVLEPSQFAGLGDAGLMAAESGAPRTRARADA